MSDPTIGSALQKAIGLYAARAAVRERLRVQVNNLSKTVEERKRLYTDLKAAEAAFTVQIEEMKPLLDPGELRALLEHYEPEGT